MSDPAIVPSRRRDFPAWIYITSFLLILAIGLLPLFATMAGIAIADANGCQISESFVSPCLIGGTDYGQTVQALGNSFWLFIISMPIAFVLFIVWLIVFVIHLMIAGRRRKAAA